MVSESPATPVVLAAFYRFTPLENAAGLVAELAAFCNGLDLLGTILIADEGLNASVAGSAAAVEALLAELRRRPAFAGLDARLSSASAAPFRRLRVRRARELIRLGAPLASPQRRGTPVSPREWDRLLDDPRVLVIDTRNDYEYRVGHFDRAADPGTARFTEFPTAVETLPGIDRKRPVAMYCTGGIRCEKASALLIERGFETVYQLEGGILAYLEQTPADASRWRGDCFVFDERVAVAATLEPAADLSLCRGCRRPLTPADRADPAYEPGVACPYCAATLSDAQRQRFRERRRQLELAGRRGGADETGAGS
ncbi:MAG: oxygen-dependent tRNA uridine(34) hydroxylase TrhO [Gammaproteobacteria bacterium]